MRNQQVIRQWQILRRLAAARAGVTLGSLSGELGVTPRTIRRDLDALEGAGFPLVNLSQGATDCGRWRVLPTSDLHTFASEVQ